MDFLERTKLAIKQVDLKPTRLKGQNFCVDGNVLDLMVKTADIKKDDVILEAGPGFGFLTEKLLATGARVIAVELEPALARPLRTVEKLNSNFTVIEQDILRADLRPYLTNNYKIAANLPYSITSFFLKTFFTRERQPESMTLLLQKEVVERICAKAGDMSLLALSVQLYGSPEIIKIVPASAFWPKPKVNSAILKITDIHPFPFAGQIEEIFFWQVLRAGFSGKRKTLENNLANSFHLPKPKTAEIIQKTGLKQMARAQELNIQEWFKIAFLLNV